MSDLFLLLLLASIGGLILGLVKPKAFSFFFKGEMTKRKTWFIFGTPILIFFVLFGLATDAEEKVKNGVETTTPVVETKTPVVETKTPVVETKTPVIETKTPVVETKTPVVEVKTGRDKMIEIFKKNASVKWGSDYAMVNYEVKNQTEAYDWVIKNAKISNILANAKEKWGNDYSMVKYEYEKQVEAYEWINQQTEYPEIMTGAKQKWGEDYSMVKYENEKQVEAYKSL